MPVMYVNIFGHETSKKRKAKIANVTAERMAMALKVGFGSIGPIMGE
jgi:phenylpyruvate tautomerase PptA (4-oxalocrotonate tautomerase family)